MNWSMLPHRTSFLRSFCVACYVSSLLVGVILVGVSTLRAADRPTEFLEALRERGWHDVAAEYLERADEDPLATDEFLDRIEYERAVTALSLAKQSVSTSARATWLERAATGFEQFSASHRGSPLSIRSLTQLGNLRNEQALQAIEKAEQLPSTAVGQRKQLLASARDFLDQARSSIESMLEEAISSLESLPKAAARQKNAQTHGAHGELEAKQAEARFLLAKLSFDRARTYADGSKQHKASLATAAKAFAELYKTYEEKLVGFYGRLYEGRCYQNAGKIKAALKCYNDLVEQPSISNADFRRLVTRAYRRRAECYLSQDKWDKAIEECSRWLDSSRTAELDQPEWLAVAFRLATAYRAKAADPDARRDASRLKSDARRLLRQVAGNSGEFQRDARAMLSTSSKSDRATIVDAKNFDEAFTAGKNALDRMNSSKLAARLAKENNPRAVDELLHQAGLSQAQAVRYFQMAVGMVDDESELDQRNACRYYLCWLYWEDGRIHDAAVIGEFLARRYPGNKFSQSAAKVALAAYERLYNEARQAKDADFQFEASKLLAMAKLLVSRWPDSPEAVTATNLLLNIALRDNRLADAEAILQSLPANRRATAELSLGASLWTRYLKIISSGNDATSMADAEGLKQRATELLEAGYGNRRSGDNPSTAEATAILYLSQLLLADGRASRAVEVLEDSSVGPLTLVQARSPSAQRPGFARETYKTALRAYLSAAPPRREAAQQMMTSLEKSVHGASAAQQLVSIYVSLGIQLQRQISELSAAGEADKAQDVAAAFEDLLHRVTEQGGASDNWKIQNWIAQTNLQLGKRLRGREAKRYFQQAEQAYTALLATAEKNPDSTLSDIALLGIRKRLGDCLAAQQKFDEAFDHYTAVLTKKPKLLELQVAVATLLQQWGSARGDAQKIEDSIRGALPQANSKNLVWGWLRLATVVDQAKRKAEESDRPGHEQLTAKYRNRFFEARYHAASARFAAAQLAEGTVRAKQLRTARRSLESMQQLYPNLGGARWKQQYSNLQRQIEKQLSQDP